MEDKNITYGEYYGNIMRDLNGMAFKVMLDGFGNDIWYDYRRQRKKKSWSKIKKIA